MDIAIFATAVADWHIADEGQAETEKIHCGIPPLQLVENPDILAVIGNRATSGRR